MISDLEDRLLMSQFDEDKVKKAKQLSRFLLDSNFAAESENPNPSNWIGKIIATYAGNICDIFLFKVINLEQQSNGVRIYDTNNVRFLNLDDDGKKYAFATRTADLGVDLFIPSYLMKPKKVSVKDGFDAKHMLFVGESAPEAEFATQEAIAGRYPPKKLITAGELKRVDKALYEAIVRKISDDALGIPEVKRRVREIFPDYSVSARLKTPESVYAHLKSRPDKKLGEVFDVNGARVICGDANACYDALERLVSELGIKENLDDRIAIPKANGFQFLRVVIEYRGKNLEVQFQTQKMEHNAKFGPASNYHKVT